MNTHGYGSTGTDGSGIEYRGYYFRLNDDVRIKMLPVLSSSRLNHLPNVRIDPFPCSASPFQGTSSNTISTPPQTVRTIRAVGKFGEKHPVTAGHFADAAAATAGLRLMPNAVRRHCHGRDVWLTFGKAAKFNNIHIDLQTCTLFTVFAHARPHTLAHRRKPTDAGGIGGRGTGPRVRRRRVERQTPERLKTSQSKIGV